MRSRIDRAWVHWLARALAFGGVAVLLGGCGITANVAPAQDDLSHWSSTPLSPDPALASKALDKQSSCANQQDPGPITILLQDRRTPMSAAFLYSTPTMFGGCTVSSGSGMTGGGAGPRLTSTGDLVHVDWNSRGGLGAGMIRELGGRVVDAASEVHITLSDGRTVFASVGNGYWLAWWPDTTFATHVTAIDATGDLVAETDVVE